MKFRIEESDFGVSIFDGQMKICEMVTGLKETDKKYAKKIISCIDYFRNIKVSNMLSSNGNPIPNQIIIETKLGRMFVSYGSNIAFIPYDNNEKIIIGKNWDYSNVTGKYRNRFLGETKKETEFKIDSGEYILDYEL